MSAPLPHWPARLLARTLPNDERRRVIVGDLQEEFAGRPAGARRTLSYTAACLRLALTYAPSRWRARSRDRMPTLESLRLDMRHSAAGLWRSRTYTSAVVATLALGIASVTTILTIAYGALDRPLPFRDPSRLIRFGTSFPTSPAGSLSSMSPANVIDVTRDARSFAAIGAYNLRRSVLITPALTERMLGANTTGNLLHLLGVQPIAGRLLDEDDNHPDSAPVAVIGERAWARLFGRAPSAVGSTLDIDLVPYTVVGIVPESAYLPGGPDFWTAFRWDTKTAARRNRHDIEPIARLRPDVSLTQAREELRAIAARLAAAYPAENGKRSIDVAPFDEWFAGSTGASSQNVLQLISIGAGVILLVALINITTLTIARTARRHRDIGILRALGASPWRLRQRRIVEAGVLALPGAVAGLGLASWCVPVVLARFGDSVPRAATIHVDVVSVTLAAACGLAATLVLVLASRAHGRHDAGALRIDTRTMTAGRPTIRRALVSAEVGLAVTVLYGALVVGSTLWALARVDLGIPVEHAATFSVGLPAQRFATPESVTEFFTTLERSLRAMPGIECVGITSRQPLAGGTNGLVSTTDRARTLPIAEWRAVSPGFFDALGVRITAGRNFDDVPSRDADNVVVSGTLAQALFGGAPALGRQVLIDNVATATIVGIAADFRDFGPSRPPRPTIYFRHGSRADTFTSSGTMNVIVRGAAEPAVLISMASAALRAQDPAVPIDRPASLATLAERAQGVSRRAAASLLIVFTLIAVTLGTIGIAGVVGFNVERRTREIGVRMALGSTPDAVMRSVLMEGLALVAAGGAAGAIGIWWINHLVTSVVIDSARPPVAVVMAVIGGALALVALAACAVPARRASRISVVEALRTD